jgi:GNAT superfamily N-acetyltransferase
LSSFEMIFVDDSGNWKHWYEVLDGMLDQHAIAQGVPFECPQLALLAKEDGEVVGGLRGFFVQGRFALEELAVVAGKRGVGVGKALMIEMEQRVSLRGAQSVYLGTWEFQAPEFYQKLGYAEFGRLPPVDGFPVKIWMAKKLLDGCQS